MNVERIVHMEAYRLYDPERPECTMAYVYDIHEIIDISIEEGVRKLVIDLT